MMYVSSHGSYLPYPPRQVKPRRLTVPNASQHTSLSFKGAPPEPPEDLKPFYNRKLIKNPTFFQKTLYILTGTALAVGFSSLVGMLCPVLAPVAALFSAFVIVGFAIDKTLPQWEKDDLKMTTEQASRAIYYEDKLKSYYRKEKIRKVKETIHRFFNKCKSLFQK